MALVVVQAVAAQIILETPDLLDLLEIQGLHPLDCQKLFPEALLEMLVLAVLAVLAVMRGVRVELPTRHPLPQLL